MFDSIKTQFIGPITNLKSFNDNGQLVTDYQTAFNKCLEICHGNNKNKLVQMLEQTLTIVKLFQSEDQTIKTYMRKHKNTLLSEA